jgi:hypothetical protein
MADFHAEGRDDHHGFKLQQQLAWVDQEPLYQIYLDLRKAYDTLDWERCLEILAGYGVGPNLLCLQKKIWNNVKMVCRVGGNYGLWEICCAINVSHSL